jgi:hypothetical protein
MQFFISFCLTEAHSAALSVPWKIREFDEKVKTHPMLVNAFPQIIFFWRGERAGMPSFHKQEEKRFF